MSFPIRSYKQQQVIMQNLKVVEGMIEGKRRQSVETWDSWEMQL